MSWRCFPALGLKADLTTSRLRSDREVESTSVRKSWMKTAASADRLSFEAMLSGPKVILQVFAIFVSEVRPHSKLINFFSGDSDPVQVWKMVSPLVCYDDWAAP